MPLPFHLLDVFTTGAAMTGNQLMVMEDREEALSDEAMLAIAKEMNFAESAFVRKADVRIFTPDTEVPQAGHPVLGLAEIVGGEAPEVTLQTRKGPITVRRAGGRWVMSQDPAEFLGEASAEDVASFLRAGAPDLVGGSFPIVSTCGLAYALVPMVSEVAVDALEVEALQPPPGPWPQGPWAVYFYFRSGDSIRARMFCYEGGAWVEDTATGSAAGPLAAHLAPVSACVTQGSKRRAQLHVAAEARDGRVDVGGTVVRVAIGQWSALP